MDATTSERGFLDALRRGDAGSFEILVRRHGGAMLRTARRLLEDGHEAEDCVQEAFLSAFRNIDGFREDAKLSTWLHRITVNAALTKLRQKGRRPTKDIDALLPEFDKLHCRVEPHWRFEQPADAMVEQRQLRDAIIEKVDELPDNYRTVLVLRDIEELSTEDVADLLDTSQANVKTRLHRARAALKKLLEPMWQEERP